jgi:hypothetical protein
MAALGCFWHPQIMPDFSLPKTSIKPYQNRPRGLMNVLFLPTLKPEEPKLGDRSSQQIPMQRSQCEAVK